MSIDRVVQLNDSAMARGGATALALASAIGLRSRDIPVTYFAGEGDVASELKQSGADIVQISGSAIAADHRLSGAAKGLYRTNVANVVTRWIQRNDTPRTVYHLHNWAHFLSPAVFSALQAVQDRLVITTHDFFLTCPNGAQYSFPESRSCPRRANSAACIAHNCDRRSYADKLWRVSRHTLRQQLFDLQDAPVRFSVIHRGMMPLLAQGGMPIDKMVPIPNPIRPFVHERVAAERNHEVLFVGRLTHEKGPDVVAEAARQAGLKIVFVGDGPMQAELEAAYPEAVFHGWKAPEEIAAIARNARMLVMPSRWAEPYGLVAGEALWSGIPVVLSENAFIAPEITGAGAGLAVPNSAAAFADAMRTIAQDDALTARMSHAAFHNTQAIGNTPDSWLDAHIRLYEERLPPVVSATHATAEQEPPALRARLFNVKYSANLGDGLIAACLESAIEHVSASADVRSVDMAARKALGDDIPARGALLKTLDALPPAARQILIRAPLALAGAMKWRPHYARELDGANCIVIGGGNLLADIDLNFPTKIGLVMQEAERLGLPVALHAVGVSGEWTRAGLARMTRALARPALKSVSVRDLRSQQLWRALFGTPVGLDAHLAADPGLLAGVAMPYSSPARTGETVVGVGITSPLSVRYHAMGEIAEGFDERYAALVEAMLQRGHRVVLFTNGAPEDRRYLETLRRPLAQLAPADRLSFEQPSDPAGLCATIAGFDLLIAHRLHAIIAGYAYGVPVVGLRWDPKLDSFLAAVSLEGHLGDLAAMPTATLAAIADAAIAAPVPESARAATVLRARAGVEQLVGVLHAAVAASARSR